MSRADAVLNEAVDPLIQRIGDVAKHHELVSMRTPLELFISKKDIDFSFSPVPHFRIKNKGKTIVVVNKKYADNADLVVGAVAIGYEGKI